MDPEDPLITSFAESPAQAFSDISSSPALTDLVDDPPVSQQSREGYTSWSTPNTSTKRQSTNYGSDIAYSDLLAAGLLSSQGFRGSQLAEASKAPAESSDYGSDFDSEEEKIIDGLFAAIHAEPQEQSFAKQAAIQGSQPDETVSLAKVPKSISTQASGKSVSTHYSSLNLEVWEPKGISEPGQQDPSHLALAKGAQTSEAPKDKANVVKEDKLPTAKPEIIPKEESGGRVPKPAESEVSPITRFRKYRPLTVSDFVAPAWCELQYFYSLSKYGKIRRTAFMKKGTEVHRTLELEVHEYVPVEVRSKEDSWGLRIWNVIQGLRALRVTGVTRELDVWGVVNGEVVSGIIDEVSTTCPDPELEATLRASLEEVTPSPHQRTITEFFGNPTKASRKGVVPPARYYLSDTKTRTTPTLPNEASFKQVKVQLMLYHFIVSLLSTGQVDADVIFKRYNLDSSAPFSDTLLAELANLELDISDNFGLSLGFASGKQGGRSPDLKSLWNSMVTEFQETFIEGSLMPLMSASFRYQADGSHLGIKSFLHDEEHLQKYASNVLRWWKGERAAQGVEIEDAFKCRICEFADGCDWRKAKEEELRARRWKRGLAKPS